MSDDRDYWRRQDDVQEQRRRDDVREQRRRDDRRDELRRADELRLDWEREGREYKAREREESRRRAMEEMRRGNTAWALNSLLGPDAALGYLRAMQQPDDDGPADELPEEDAGPQWPPHPFVTTLDELLANVASASPDVALHAVRIDSDGDALVEARWEPSSLLTAFPTLARQLAEHPLSEPGQFWVRPRLLDDIAPVAATLRRTAELAAAIERMATET